MKKFITALLLATSLSACTVIETGSVGVRRDFSNVIETDERLPGSWNQVLVGDVMTFPTKDVSVEIKDMTPLAADNSTLADFDLQLVYSLNPSQVAELYIAKSRSFHAVTNDGDTLLMYNYMTQLGRNAAYKVARAYPALRMADNRAEIERLIQAEINQQLTNERLATSITLSQVLVRQITPAPSIVASANALVNAQNERSRKEVEVGTARLEAERIAALSANTDAIEYMNAQARLAIAEGVREGKVNTVVVPADFRGMVNVSN